jgi:alpha-ketoglutarate-dependent taurine dioxygenase
MTTTDKTRSLEEIREAGFEALRRELGPRELVLFLRQFITPSGDYTAERAELHADTTVADVMAAIEKLRAAREQTQDS